MITVTQIQLQLQQIQPQAKHVLPCLWISAGELSIKKNADDEPEFNLATDEKFAAVIEKIFNMTWDTGS